MKNEIKTLINAQILTFLNQYLKHGNIIKATDPFYARGTLEKIIAEAYEIGKLDGKQEKVIDTYLDKIKS